MILQERFQAFDWGEQGNLGKYGARTPPQVDLGKATPPQAIYVAQVLAMVLVSVWTICTPREMTTWCSQRTTKDWWQSFLMLWDYTLLATKTGTILTFLMPGMHQGSHDKHHIVCSSYLQDSIPTYFWGDEQAQIMEREYSLQCRFEENKDEAHSSPSTPSSTRLQCKICPSLAL